VSENKVQEFLKKNPPWFMFDFHPILSAKKRSERRQEDEEEINADGRYEQ
jgi:hypothetical protein